MEVAEPIQKTEVAKRDYFLPVSILIAGVMIAGAVVYAFGRVSPANPGQNNVVAAAPNGQLAAVAAAGAGRDVILGDPKAPVTIIEYGDYQCPFCARFFSDTEPLIRAAYVNTGKARMVYRNFPFLGPESTDSAEAAECAKDQQKFWAFHDGLYAAEKLDATEGNGNLNRSLFIKIAGNVGMDTAAFTSCFDSKKYAAIVDQEVTDAKNAGVDSTPTFFINGSQIKGAIPFEGDGGFKSIINNALKSK